MGIDYSSVRDRNRKYLDVPKLQIDTNENSNGSYHAGTTKMHASTPPMAYLEKAVRSKTRMTSCTPKESGFFAAAPHYYCDGKRHRKDLFENRYSVKSTLGCGSTGKVKRVIRKSDGIAFAAKIVKKTMLNEARLRALRQEIDIMRHIDHPNCVRLEEVYETDNHLILVMELLLGGEMFDRILANGSHSEAEASHAMRNIAEALHYLHSKKIVHRDLKPENLVYASDKKDSNVKVADFGLSSMRKSAFGLLKTTCGTSEYIAPEILRGKRYTQSVDIWSLGVVLYTLLAGEGPFTSESAVETHRKIMKGNYNFNHKCWRNISEGAKKLIKRMLVLEPMKRITAYAVLKDPWVQGLSCPTPSNRFNAAHINRFKLFLGKQKLQRFVRILALVKMFESYVNIIQEELQSSKKSSFEEPLSGSIFSLHGDDLSTLDGDDDCASSVHTTIVRTISPVSHLRQIR